MCISQAFRIVSTLSPITMWDQVIENTVATRFIEKDEMMLGVQVEKL